MSLMDMINKGPTPGPRRLMVYGVHGVGKSTFGASAPESIFIPTEDGLADIDCDSFPLCHTLEEAQAAMRAVFSETHDYKTLVIDSLDWMERMVWESVCLAGGKQNISDFGFGKGYAMALAEWQKILAMLDKIRDRQDMHVLLLAHAKIERFENPETEAYDRYSPRLHKGASGIVQEWASEVLFANYKVFTKTKDEGGFRGERTIGIGTGERVLRTSYRPAHEAKNRLALPDEIPLDWAALAKHFPENKEDSSND